MPPLDHWLPFGLLYRWRIAREILNLRGDRELALPYPAVTHNPTAAEQLGPNVIENPSFETAPRPAASLAATVSPISKHAGDR